ncbi:MAG: carboxypeptidase-like regulatory domain-containing protein [Prolixibacteraceae bacterium]
MCLCRFSLFFTILLFSLTIYGQDGSVLERKVSLNAENTPLSNILDQISWQTRVYFSYDASQIDGAKQHTIQVIEKSMYSVLHELFNSDKFEFTELENQVIISQKNNNQIFVNEEKEDTVPVKYFFLSGQIIDEKKENPIIYASVSVFNKPIGTITNTDGEFLLKLHPGYMQDTLVISCMGYAQIIMPAYELLDRDLITMKPVSVRIREVKVTSTSPEQLLKKIRENMDKNYASDLKLMTAFYRETLKQDKNYIDASEAVIEVLKSPYSGSSRNDLVRLVKGRQSPEVQPFTWLNFKLQGGPYTITKLDVVKTVETFIDEKFQEMYEYKIDNVIRYNEYPVYVLKFKPLHSTFSAGYAGELYVHRETYAILHASFGFNRAGLKHAENILIKRKPLRVKAKPTYVQYEVDYQLYRNKWHLQTARASVKIKIRSRKDKINSEFHSVSELLITNIESTGLKRFPRQEVFKQRDIFVEMIDDYDPAFWENYNIIKPDEDLRNAFENLSLSKN